MQERKQERGVNVCTLLVPPSHTFEPDAILSLWDLESNTVPTVFQLGMCPNELP